MLGPDNALLQVMTFREGVAAVVGHDLVLDVTRWQATFSEQQEGATIELSADPRSLQVREGLRGAKPLTDKDRAEIRRNIDEKVLRGQPISFRSTSVDPADGGRRLSVRGDLTMAGDTRPIAFELRVDPDGHVRGIVAVTQSDWGIKPYRGLMGALRVRDSVEVVIDARLPSG
jgi:polyisoprenoid-binding protein YceI